MSLNLIVNYDKPHGDNDNVCNASNKRRKGESFLRHQNLMIQSILHERLRKENKN